MQYIRSTFLCLLCLIIAQCTSTPDIKIGYVRMVDSLSVEDESVIDWLDNHPNFDVTIVRPTSEETVDIYWIHLPDSVSYEEWTGSSGPRWFEKKSNQAPFLLTNFAAFLPSDVGFEEVCPTVQSEKISDDWLFDQKGLQSRGGHPVFKDFHGGVFIWDAYENHTLQTVGYFDDAFPQNGTVLGVEKAYVTVWGDRRLMVDHQRNGNQILSIGGLINFSDKNRLDHHQKLFLESCLRYIHEKKDLDQTNIWQDYKFTPQRFHPSPFRFRTASHRRMNDLPLSGLLIRQKNPGQNYYDISGRRMLIMGKEAGGIDEVWVHPFRIARDIQSGIVMGDSVAWLRHIPSELEIRPESITRIYQTPMGILKELIFPSQNHGSGLIHYEIEDGQDIQLVISLRIDMRWMWPYDEYALGPIYYGYDDTSGVLSVRDEHGEFSAIFGGDVPPVDHIEGAFKSVSWNGVNFQGDESELNQVYHGAVFSLDASNDYCLNYALAGTNEGVDVTEKHFRQMLKNPRQEYSEITNDTRNVLNNYVTVESPDNEFNDLWKWTLIGTDRFWVNTPPHGTALVAGYSTTARGWDGRHKINGRPGYGWYFGRDAAWSAFAINDYGDVESVRDQLTFFQKFQDPTGKIFHELSTSGVLHYDAADATPMFIILAAHYLRASGDLSFIRDLWPSLKQALDFCYSTDTDDDGLIENTHVGHGWVEGGALWGAHTTLYLAGLWAQALSDATDMAELCGDGMLANKYRNQGEKVRKQINSEFWNRSENFSYYGKWIDGSFNKEQTMLPAVVLYYQLLDKEKAAPMLREWATNGYSTNWGMRILNGESDQFNPRSYHGGSVWPLYTGWTALAEYAYNRPIQGFSHIYNNMMIKNHWSLGFVEEVMHGLEYTPTGVCPHQCWSETNILHPGIHGMIGWKPDAVHGRAKLEPQIPVHWDSVTVRQLRVGQSKVTLKMIRQSRWTDYCLHLEKGKPVKIQLRPQILDGMQIEEIIMDGDPLSLDQQNKNQSYSGFVDVNVKSKHTIRIRHRGGISMVPVMLKPLPGDAAHGPRIVDTALDQNIYTVDLEGPAAQTADFKVKAWDQDMISIKGGEIQGGKENGIFKFSVKFPPSHLPYSSRTVEIMIDKTDDRE